MSYYGENGFEVPGGVGVRGNRDWVGVSKNLLDISGKFPKITGLSDNYKWYYEKRN